MADDNDARNVNLMQFNGSTQVFVVPGKGTVKVVTCEPGCDYELDDDDLRLELPELDDEDLWEDDDEEDEDEDDDDAARRRGGATCEVFDPLELAANKQPYRLIRLPVPAVGQLRTALEALSASEVYEKCMGWIQLGEMLGLEPVRDKQGNVIRYELKVRS